MTGYKPDEAIQRVLIFGKNFPTNTEMLKSILGQTFNRATGAAGA